MGWDQDAPTFRQVLAWEEWEAIDLEVPGKAELYSAQIAMEVARIPGAVWGSPPALKLHEFVLRRAARPKDDGPVPVLTADAKRVATMNASKARAVAAVGGADKITYVYLPAGGG